MSPSGFKVLPSGPAANTRLGQLLSPWRKIADKVNTTHAGIQNPLGRVAFAAGVGVATGAAIGVGLAAVGAPAISAWLATGLPTPPGGGSAVAKGVAYGVKQIPHYALALGGFLGLYNGVANGIRAAFNEASGKKGGGSSAPQPPAPPAPSAPAP